MVIQLIRYFAASIAWACAIAALAAQMMAGVAFQLQLTETIEQEYFRSFVVAAAIFSLFAVAAHALVKRGGYRISTESYVIIGIFAAFVSGLSIAIMLVHPDQQWTGVFISSGIQAGFAIQSLMIWLCRKAWSPITIDRRRVPNTT